MLFSYVITWRIILRDTLTKHTLHLGGWDAIAASKAYCPNLALPNPLVDRLIRDSENGAKLLTSFQLVWHARLLLLITVSCNADGVRMLRSSAISAAVQTGFRQTKERTLAKCATMNKR